MGRKKCPERLSTRRGRFLKKFQEKLKKINIVVDRVTAGKIADTMIYSLIDYLSDGEPGKTTRMEFQNIMLFQLKYYKMPDTEACHVYKENGITHVPSLKVKQSRHIRAYLLKKIYGIDPSGKFEVAPVKK